VFTNSTIGLIIRLRKDTVGSTPTRPTSPIKAFAEIARLSINSGCALFCYSRVWLISLRRLYTVVMNSIGSGFGSLAKQDSNRCCWSCTHWEIEYPRPRAVTCLHDLPIRISHSFPNEGCAFYRREPGSDDELEK
jgi:hypothetical protein